MKKIIGILFILSLSIEGYSQLITKDTTWLWGINEDNYFRLDTCIEEMSYFLNSEFNNLRESPYEYVKFERYGLDHSMWSTSIEITQDTFLVEHGITSCYYRNGNLGRFTTYNKGVRLQEISYDKVGRLKSETRLDTIQKLWIENNYDKGLLVNTKHYLKTDSCIQVNWYPNNNLRTSHGEIMGNLDLTKDSIVREQIKLSARFLNTKVSLFFDDGVKVRIDDLELKSGDTIEVKLKTDTTLDLEILHDKQAIVNRKNLVLRRKFDEINIPIKIKGCHIDYSKVEQDYKFIINQNKNSKILIDQIGTSTSIGFSGTNIEEGINVGFQACKINLANLPKGDYNINIGSCHTSGNIQVEIK